MDLKIFATTIEQDAISQVYRLASQPQFKNAKIRIMPDAHAGAGCTIGFTANLGDKVVPNLVGVDIGCGMLVANIGKIDLDLSKLDNVIRTTIPCGSEVNTIQGTRVEFEQMEDLIMYKDLRNLLHLQSSIGTLGSGNHFLEIDSADWFAHIILESILPYALISSDRCRGKNLFIFGDIGCDNVIQGLFCFDFDNFLLSGLVLCFYEICLVRTFSFCISANSDGLSTKS